MDYKLTFEDGSEAYLTHYGIRGQKWGHRHFQYKDGTLTPEGIKRYRELNKKFGTKTGYDYANAHADRRSETNARDTVRRLLPFNEIQKKTGFSYWNAYVVSDAINESKKKSIDSNFKKRLLSEHKNATMSEVDDYFKLHVVADQMRKKGYGDL